MSRQSDASAIPHISDKMLLTKPLLSVITARVEDHSEPQRTERVERAEEENQSQDH